MYALHRTLTLLVSFAGLLAVAGCSSGVRRTDSHADAQHSADHAEHAEAVESLTPAATVPGIWSQIEAEQKRLAQFIDNGQLDQVHHVAFGVRDLVIALADHAKGAMPGSATQLNALVEQVKASATKLDAAGDSGDLGGTKAEFSKLGVTLESLRTLTNTK